DVAVVVDVHGRRAQVGEAVPVHGARPVHDGDLGTRVVEGVPGIGRAVDRDGRDARPAETLDVRHGGAVRPAGHAYAVRVDPAARHLLRDETVDGPNVHVLG